MSELSALRAQYKELSGKNASPSMKADALQAKIAELQAPPPAPDAPDAPAPDAPAPDAPAPEPDAPAPDAPAPDAPAPDDAANVVDVAELSVEDACAELGLAIEADGHCPVEMLESVSGGINRKPGDPHRFEAAEAVRAVRAGIAKPRA